MLSCGRGKAKLVMTEEELKAFRRSLSMLSEYHVEEQYAQVLEQARVRAGRVPQPIAMQELATI